MKSKAKQHNPPEQKTVNELWQMLGASSNEEAVQHARELVTALNNEPIFLTLVVNRVTNAITLRHNVRREWGEGAIQQLREAMKQIDESLVQNLAQLAEERGKASIPAPIPVELPATETA